MLGWARDVVETVLFFLRFKKNMVCGETHASPRDFVRNNCACQNGNQREGSRGTMLHCDGPHVVGWSVVVWGFLLWNMLQMLVPVARAAVFCGMLFCEGCKCRRRRQPTYGYDHDYHDYDFDHDHDYHVQNDRNNGRGSLYARMPLSTAAPRVPPRVPPAHTSPAHVPVGKCLICFQDPAEDPVWCKHCSVQREEGRACCRRCLWAWTRTGSPTCPLCRSYTH
jgi:hypothetical protein